MKDEFYIGWQNNAPNSYGQWVKYVVWTVVIAIPLIGGLLVLSQRGFIGSTYEISRLRTLEGVLQTEPIPCLQMPLGVDEKGKEHFQRVLLVGFGKKSAAPMLKMLEQKTGQSIDGMGIRLKGKLIHYDGMLAFELGPKDVLFQGFSKVNRAPTSPLQLGKATLRGEILDPKCYLGVMRPGEGKPHRSCAVRCIEGGIPAFFKASTAEDFHQYFFILDQNGQVINHALAAYVADEVQICGKVEQWDNWYILKTDAKQDLRRLSPYWAKGQDIPMCH